MSPEFKRLLNKYPVLPTIISQHPRAPLSKLLEWYNKEDLRIYLILELTIKVAERIMEQWPQEKKLQAGEVGEEIFIYEVSENLWGLCDAGLEAGVLDLRRVSSSVCVFYALLTLGVEQVDLEAHGLEVLRELNIVEILLLAEEEAKK
jgi:hypothetical protein